MAVASVLRTRAAAPVVGAFVRFSRTSKCRAGSVRETLYSLHQGEINICFPSYRSYPGLFFGNSWKSSMRVGNVSGGPKVSDPPLFNKLLLKSPKRVYIVLQKNN